MKRIDFHRVFVIVGLISLVIIYAVLWLRMIFSPAQRTGADFFTFYTAGRISTTGNPSEIYSPEVQHRVEESILGFSIDLIDINPFVHPPLVVPLLALVSFLPYEWAFTLWAAFMFGVYILSADLLVKVSSIATGRVVLFAGCILFFPAFVSLVNGQDTALLLLGASLWVAGLIRKEDGLAGIGLGLMLIRPHIAIFLALPFIFRRRSVWWWFVGTAILVAIAGILLITPQGVRNFLNLLLISGSGEGFKTNETAMVNLIGLLRRLPLGIAPGTVRYVGWIFFALALVLACFIWVRSSKLDERHYGLVVLLSLFFTPHLHYHDLALLLVPIICFILVLSRRGKLKEKNSSLLPLVASLFLLLGWMIPGMKFVVPYLVMVFLVLFLSNDLIFSRSTPVEG